MPEVVEAEDLRDVHLRLDNGPGTPAGAIRKVNLRQAAGRLSCAEC